MKKILAMLAITGMIATASAVEITPGQQNNITSNTSNLEDQSSNLPLTFNNENSTLYASAPEGFPSQTGTITLNYTNSSQQLNAEIIEYSDWNLNTENFEQNVSVGETGRLGVINFTQKGNTQADLQVEADGNLTEYISFDDEFTLFPQNTIKKTFSYNIPSSTEFGNYTARFNFTENSTDINKTVNISTVFEDNIDPEIDSVSFSDVMSTRSQNFTVSVSENYNVSSVEAELIREAEEERDNTTVLVNKSVGTESFERQAQEWRTEFSDTENIGQYYYTLTVEDEAGNSVNKTGSFRVEGLNAVNVLTNNFRFDSVYPKDASGGIIDDKVSKARKDVFDVSEETSVDIELRNFQHTSENSTVSVGVLKPGEDVADKFDLGEDTPSMTVEGTGVYRLVVESDSVESFSGSLRLELVDQHVGSKVRSIEFEGQVNNPDYPPEQEWSIRGWNASLEYDDVDEDGEPDVIRRTLVADAGVCRGYSSPEDCPEINDFEEQTEDVKQENEKLRSDNRLFVSLGLSGLLFGVVFSSLIMRRYAARPIVGVKPVEDEDYDELFTDEELREYGVLN